MARKKRKTTKAEVPQAEDDRTPHSVSSNTASRVVFETPELLEMIISLLSFSRILTKAQRVSRSWKSTIAQSPAIQRKPGLRPEAHRVTTPISFLPRNILGMTRRLTRRSTDLGQILPVYPASLNKNRFPRLRGLGHCWETRMTSKLARPRASEGPKFYAIRLPKHDLAQVSRASRPTWHGMFVTEPRITVVVVELELEREHEEGEEAQYYLWASASVREPGGLTFGAVLVAAEKMRRSAPVGTEGRENARVWVWFAAKG